MQESEQKLAKLKLQATWKAITYKEASGNEPLTGALSLVVTLTRLNCQHSASKGCEKVAASMEAEDGNLNNQLKFGTGFRQDEPALSWRALSR